jgi:hypothetical protein
MSAFFIIAAIFITLGVYLFALYRWWYGYLIALADRYDIAERRRRAAQRYLLVLPIVVAPTLCAVLSCVSLFPKIGVFTVIAFVCSIAPAMIWFIRGISRLQDLGYGKQRQ